MGYIYLNGDCNLCATGFPDGKRGMLCDRDPTSSAPAPILLPDQKVMYVVYTPNDKEVRPLSQRDWVFQEHVLAPRSLQFTRHDMTRVCRRCHATQVWKTGCPMHLLENGFDAGKAVFGRVLSLSDIVAGSATPVDGILSAIDESTRNKYISLWYENVMDPYSTTQLSCPEDKLPAASGLAAIFHTHLNVRYLAGHWETQFLKSLFWKQDDEVDLYHKHQLQEEKPLCSLNPIAGNPRYIAPTWSCMTAKSRAMFHLWSDDKSDIYISNLLNVDVIPATSDPFGAVNDGYLYLYGPLCGLVIDKNQPKWRFAVRLFGHILVSLKIFPDEPLSLSNVIKRYYQKPLLKSDHKQRDIFILPILSSGERINGLLLQKARGKIESFARIGAIDLSSLYKPKRSSRSPYPKLAEIVACCLRQPKREIKII